MIAVPSFTSNKSTHYLPTLRQLERRCSHFRNKQSKYLQSTDPRTYYTVYPYLYIFQQRCLVASLKCACIDTLLFYFSTSNPFNTLPHAPYDFVRSFVRFCCQTTIVGNKNHSLHGRKGYMSQQGSRANQVLKHGFK